MWLHPDTARRTAMKAEVTTITMAADAGKQMK
jgi:hypothetical protein